MPDRTAARRRQYRGPAFFSAGFRPFFLGAAMWAAVAMLLWLAQLSGALSLPAAFDPLDWHVHELLFGYGAAVVCGFLLTAIPKWTGRLPVTGLPLAGLLAIWALGRVAVTLGGALPGALVAITDLAFLTVLSLIVGREIIAGGARRNLPVLGLALLLLVGNAGFHLGAAGNWPGDTGPGLRLGTAALIMLLTLIGGRVVPSFTRNWLAQQAPGRLPAAFGRFDHLCLAVTAATLAVWVTAPDRPMTGGMLALTGVLNLARLIRWAGWRTGRAPLVSVLHAGYAFVPIGFLLLGAAALGWLPGPLAGLHAWLAGGVGLMTMAVMTRASRGHTGRPLVAGPADVSIYLAIALAALARIAQALGAGPGWLLNAAGAGWIAAFALFAIVYWPVLTRPRRAGKKAGKVTLRG